MKSQPITKSQHAHSWNVSPEEAVAIQRQLADQVSFCNSIPERARYVVGADISPPDPAGMVVGSAVVMSLPDLEVVEVKRAWGRPGFPYVPGLLSFREAPLVLAALERLKTSPDFLLADGQGIAHPRRFGLACHIGVLADIPAIGCAKSILVGKCGALEEARGSCAPLVHRNEVVGAALRTRNGVKPIYVSVGHKVDLDAAMKWTLACCKGYKMPEPTRLAHLAAAGNLKDSEPREALQEEFRD